MIRTSVSSRLKLDTLESRLTPASLGPNSTYAVGAGPGGVPIVRVYDADSDVFKGQFLAFDASFRGGVSVAVGDVNGDGTDDVVCGALAGGGPHVRAYSGTDLTTLLFDQFVYDAAFAGGVNVAVGNLTADTSADIVTGAGSVGGPHVKAFDVANDNLITEFLAYDPEFTGGVTVAVGRVAGATLPDIVTGPGPGSVPLVRVWEVDGNTPPTNVDNFFPFDEEFTGGVNVAVGNLGSTFIPLVSPDSIIAGAGPGGVPVVRVDDLSAGSGANSFKLPILAYDAAFAGGVHVGVCDFDFDGRGEIVTGAGVIGGPHVKVFDGQSAAELESYLAYDSAFTGGVWVG